jgi:diguanylate cyclase (GGDEF)-like protein
MEHRYDITEQFVLNERWLFDVAQDQLTDLQRHSPGITLQPVAARILALFVQAPRVVHRRRQLLDDGWRAFGFEVCENSLNQVMCTLRSTFEAIDPTRTYIRTVPRIGYCLLAEVRPAVAADLEPHLPASSSRLTSPVHPDVVALADPAIDRHADTEAAADANWRKAQTQSAPMSLLLIDIDQLRSVNNRYGRKTGDDLLSSVERAVHQQLHRSGDCVVRHDGATLAVRLPDTGQAGAMHVAQCIRESMRGLDWRGGDGTVQPVSVSIGLACTAPGRFDTAKGFVKAAAAALHEAKQAGGNQTVGDPHSVEGPIVIS